MDGLNVLFSIPFQDSSIKSKFPGFGKTGETLLIQERSSTSRILYPLIKLYISLWKMKWVPHLLAENQKNMD